MNERSLQDDLLRIPGVEGAEVEGSADKPAGLRIRIAEGADQGAVGGAIRRVLTSHGLGTDTRLPGEPNHDGGEAGSTVPPREEGPDSVSITRTAVTTAENGRSGSGVAVAPADASRGASVIDLTDRASAAAPEVPADVSVPDQDEVDAHQPAGIEDDLDDTVSPEPPAEVTRMASGPHPEVGDLPDHDHRPDDGDSPGGFGARLASVAVQEGRTGIVVTVSASDGSQIQQAAASTEGGVESAVVRATARLAMPGAPDAAVIEIEDRRIEGVDIVLIVLDVDGAMHAGAAVVGAGRSFALGRATWAALTL